jgi:nucleotide-binding universal stress UspA family protein
MSNSGAGNDRRIVVGVDGSPASKSALRWAIGQARLTGASVEAVTAYRIPPPLYQPPKMNADIDIKDFEESARRVLMETVSEVSATGSGVQMDQQVIHGNPANVLVDEAYGADLLVLGNRGHSGFTEALLGSVGQHSVHHAPCPVVITRSDEPDPDDERDR